MTNKFRNFKLMLVYGDDNGRTIRLGNLLVDTDKQKLIRCSYQLQSPKDVTATGVFCAVLDIPMKIEDGVVYVNYHTLVHKLNSGHHKKVDYDDLCLEHPKDFAIFL